MNTIAFPRLSLKFKINPVALDIPFLGGVHWYGVIIAAGIIAAIVYCCRVAKREGENPDNITDLVLVALPAAVICARAYYVAFSWSDYRKSPLDIIKIWEGGIAIYGGLIGAVIAALVFLKAKKLNILKMFDICSLGLLVGQAVGRWGNFVNGEAYGGYCALPWGMSINGGECVHPTFLYESLWNTLGFVILSKLNKKRPFHGFTFFSYILWYGMGRFFIEGMRADSLYLGNVRISQAVAAVCVLTGAAFLAVNFYKYKKKVNKTSENNEHFSTM